MLLFAFIFRLCFLVNVIAEAQLQTVDDNFGSLEFLDLPKLIMVQLTGRRVLRECKKDHHGSVLCKDTVTLNSGEKCKVKATCPLKSNFAMTECSCSIEIDGKQCQACAYCDDHSVTIDCTGVFKDANGCSGVNCSDGECIRDSVSNDIFKSNHTLACQNDTSEESTTLEIAADQKKKASPMDTLRQPSTATYGVTSGSVHVDVVSLARFGLSMLIASIGILVLCS